ncbi:hypothetical protein [Cohnella terricola]|uniref:hypothetical protein n=1 Tax=Cohnella terricola TaxID=1289167 RepID=UPI0016441391|nr:hypothetical protein [Cohnella terricola]
MINIKRKILITIIVLLVVIGLSTLTEKRAFACSCVGGSAKDKLESHSVVFVGKVIKKGGTIKSQIGGLREYTFDVHKAWKGVSSNTITIYSYDGSEASCGMQFILGESYLVFSNLDKDESLQTNYCSGNLLVSQAENEIKQLGIGTTFSAEEDILIVTEKENDKGSMYVPVLGVGILILISILLYWRFKKRTLKTR